MERWLAEANPAHYRLLALYLQVLREVLPGCVDQAVFQLATQIHPARYAALSPERRAGLHRRLADLVHRCASLLTVEQLSSLAARVDRQRRSRRRERQRLLVQRLIAASRPSGDSGEPHASHDPGAPLGAEPGSRPWPTEPITGAEPPAVRGLPPGSVTLALESPFGMDRGGWISPDADGFGEEDEEPGLAPDHDEDEAEGQQEIEMDALESVSRSGVDADLEDLFGWSWRRPDQAEQPQSVGGEQLLESDSEPDGTELAEDSGDAARPGPWPGGGPGQGLLPRDPLQLEAWLRGYEQALAHCLRTLSHAINTELANCGLIALMVPASLLDAVLEGRIETLAAAPNLMRLQLPMALPGMDQPLQPTVVLLRCADLELEQPRLRSVRRDLQQRRLESRRMAEHHRRLQRRLQARKAEALWLQDIRTRREAGSSPIDPP